MRWKSRITIVPRKSLCDITATKRAAKGEGANQMNLEWLRKGSEFHKVSPSGNDFSIQAVDKSDITLEGFHMIVQMQWQELRQAATTLCPI